MELINSRIIKGEKVFITSKNEIVGQGRRTIRDGSSFTHLIKIEDVKNTSSLTYGNVDNTVQMMCSIIEKYHYQVNDLANFLKKDTELETCKSIWNFVFNHVQYKRDRADREQLSTPARIWLNREKEGTPSDCDDHTVLVGSLLYCLGIPFKIRIAGYDGNPFSHVYPVTQSNICVDTVLHAFNKEAYYTSKQDSKIMQIETLQGYEDDTEELGTLGAVDALQQSAEDYDNQSENFVGEEEMDEADPEVLNGFADALNKEENALRTLSVQQLGITLSQYRKEPDLYHAKGFSPEYWQHMQEAYDSLKNNDTLEGIIVNMGTGAKWERQNLSPVNGIENDYGETVGMMGALHGWFKKIGRKIRHGVKKIGKAIKKASKWAIKIIKKIHKFMMRINPVMIIVRSMLRLKIKKNKKNMAIKMGYGLLTQKEALSCDVSLSDWKKAKRTCSKFLKKYSFLGGKTSKVKGLIKKSWIKYTNKKGLKNIKLNGLGDLGQLEGRRRRRRRRRRKARALARAKELKSKRLASKAYSIDKRANDAAAHKLKNRSKWELERMAFLKETFKSESRMLKGTGLGFLVSGTVASAAAIVVKILAWLMKLLKGVGLGKVVEKLKKKHIVNIKDKLSKAIKSGATGLAKSLKKKLNKAENNLAVFKAIPTRGDKRAPQQTPVYKPAYVESNQPSTYKPKLPASLPSLTTKTKTQKASFGMIGGIVLGLAALGMAFGSGDKKKESKTKSKK